MDNNTSSPDPDLKDDSQAEEDKEVRGETEKAREVLPQSEPTDIDPLEE